MREVSKQLILGIDGGATKTEWVLCQQGDKGLQPLERGRLGPGNMRLLSPDQLQTLLEACPRQATHVGVFLAACATDADRKFLASVAEATWPEAAIRVGSDRDSGFAAAFGEENGITVIAGTGSAVTGRKDGQEDRAGGWGHLLGDIGGGYDLVLQSLRRIMLEFDTERRISPLANDFLRALSLNTLTELTAWAQGAQKADLARLTPALFHHRDDAAVAKLLNHGAEALARQTAAVAARLKFESPSIRLLGGVFHGQPLYAQLFTDFLTSKIPSAHVALSETSGSMGAARLALSLPGAAITANEETPRTELLSASTEQTNPRSAKLDAMPVRELVELFIREERMVEMALAECAEPLTQAVEVVHRSLSTGRRLFYVGAGTSGRLGVLDASEIPPTFGFAPERVQAIMAGGAIAIHQSVEGAEDDIHAGRQAILHRGVKPGDTVCGLTASGRTPFVFGALAEARARGAATILISCNPARRSDFQPDVAIDLPTGPELLAGSTRLKAGTATKIALNILTTCSMIRLGRVKGNRMSHMMPTNEKLRYRAIHIVAATLGVSESEAKERLVCANWDINNVLHATNGGH